MLKKDRGIQIGLILVIAISSALFLIPSTTRASGGAWTVNTVDDTDDGTCDTTHCSLREAINHVNALPGNQLIWFDIPGPAPHIIQLCGFLPPITDAVEIDGAQPPGSIGPPTVVIKPYGPLPITHVIQCTPPPLGFFVASSDVTIRNLSMVGFNSPAFPLSGAIVIASGANNVVEHNYLGIYPNGTALGNRAGVLLGSDGVLVRDNVISGNWFGISAFAADAIIQGNFIGTDPAGAFTSADLRNEVGVDLGPNANASVIGGTNPPMMNVISGNGIGIDVRSGSHAIIGNHIGTDLAGSANLGNSNGIIITTPNNNVGGTIPGAGNLISGNHLGISIGSAGDGNVIINNRIGSDVTGSLPIPNFTGIIVSGQDNTIGGLNPNEANLIAFNLLEGIKFSMNASANLVIGNRITGNKSGVYMLYDGITDLPLSNAINKNSIYANVNLGIDLEQPPGVSPNDPGDGDDGANTLRNFPVFSSISATLAQGEACPGCSVEVFLSDNDPSGYGEGETLAGEAVADAGGHFSAALSGLSACDWVTGTATDAMGNTSEFAENWQIQPCYTLSITVIVAIPIGLIIFGALVGGLFGRPSKRPGPGSGVGAAGGLLIAAALLGIAFIHPNIMFEPRVDPDETRFAFPPCEYYLDPTGRFPKSGAIYNISEDPTLTWLPRDNVPSGDIRWMVQLFTPDNTTQTQSLTTTSLAFSSFGLVPEDGDVYAWRIWGEEYIMSGYRGFCSSTFWWSFRFGPLPELETPPWRVEMLDGLTPGQCRYTAIRNPVCRASDYVEAEQVAVLQHGEIAELIALNPELTHGQFELASMEQCWIVLELMDGPDDPAETCDSPIVDPAPKPAEIPDCSPDLEREACEESGGTWTEGRATGAQCVCP